MRETVKNLLLILLMLVASPGFSKHIIGGEITYECMGNGTYKFTMNIYRDCNGGGAEFDNPAHIGIYRGSGPYILFDQVDAMLISDQPVAENDVACLDTPPNVCVEEGIYQFTVNGLDLSSEIYHISYQRCCRNETIDNILEPESSGATYTMELLPAAQDVCNNSPVYDDFPPIIICANSYLYFDHGATDPDGDQLVYSFCSPLLGGGLLGTPDNPGDAGGCDGVMPTPACAPPYDEVDFDIPTYYDYQPLAGDPIVSIDANTGIITGVPETVGQFVVGVCVSEYRNGQLLSVVRRDFQFNVADCNPLVLADIEADEIIDGNDFVVNICGDSTVTFVNQSVQEQNIFDFRWEFAIGANVETFTDWNPTVTFPDLGVYQGILYLNPGEDCADTANIYVNVYPDLEADFSFTYDTCVAGPVDFTDLSLAPFSTITDWDWSYQGGAFSEDQNPDYQFPDPGFHNIQLLVTDENGCVDSTTLPIDWFPAPAILVIEPTSFVGCEPLEVFFNNLSTPIDDSYDIIWDFGDGGTSGEISPTYVYEDEGLFTISLDITSPLGCQIDTIFPDWILVHPSPIADFTFSPTEVSSFAPTVTFSDESFEPSTWFWDFDGDGFSNFQNPEFTFPDTGLQAITLVVTHLSGCVDSITQYIDVVPRVNYFLPNAFTPNFDDVNDNFMGGGIFQGMQNFEMTIWNRWGELIFETDDPYTGWNGKKYNTGAMSPQGLYICQVTYTGPRGQTYELKGYATLIK